MQIKLARIRKTLLSLLLMPLVNVHAKAPSLSTDLWSHLMWDLEFKSWEQNSPTSSGTLQESVQAGVETTPQLVLGMQNTLPFGVQNTIFGGFQYRLLGSEEDMYPNPFAKEGPYPDKLAQETLLLHIDLRAPPLRWFLAGFAFEKIWSKTRWKHSEWDPYTHLLIAPWVGWNWDGANQSYLSFITEQMRHPSDPQVSFKVEPELFSRYPSLRLSHVWSWRDWFKLGAAYRHEKRIFEDFWYDQTGNDYSLGGEFRLWEPLSFWMIAGLVEREFEHPWKRNGPCGRELGARTQDFYLWDAASCYRHESVKTFDAGLSWEIFENFRVGSSYRLASTSATEGEFSNQVYSVILFVSWESMKTTLSDPLRRFLPWAYEGHRN